MADAFASVPPAWRIATAYPRMAPYADLIVETSARVGIDPAWLANIIQLESGGNPQAVNRSGPNPTYATGLIQFLPRVAKEYGTTVEALVQMDGRQQMPYVEAYFRRQIQQRGPLRSQEDVIGAVFYPAHIGQPDKEFPPNVQRANGGLRTLRDYTRKLQAKAKLPVEGIGFGGGGVGLPGVTAPGGDARSTLWWSVAAVAAIGLLLTFNPFGSDHADS